MSNQDRILSDEELEYELQSIFYPEIKHFALSKKAIKLHKAKELFNTQKKLYAESVIGEDNWSNSTGTISSGGQTIKKSTYINIRNQLRAEQRARITTNKSKETTPNE